jgi:hypothetical protein
MRFGRCGETMSLSDLLNIYALLMRHLHQFCPVDAW